MYRPIFRDLVLRALPESFGLIRNYMIIFQRNCVGNGMIARVISHSFEKTEKQVSQIFSQVEQGKVHLHQAGHIG